MNVIKDKLPSSSTKQLKRKETIFDYFPTETEIKKIFPELLLPDVPNAKEDYINLLSQDTHYYHIYSLYTIRNEKELANKYYKMAKTGRSKREKEREKNMVKDIIEVYN